MNTYTRMSKMQKLLMLKQVVHIATTVLALNVKIYHILPRSSESAFHDILFRRCRSMAYAVDKMLLNN
jgi:hypothetical protein